MECDPQVPDGWQSVRLGDVAEVIGGSTPSRSKKEFWDGNVSWVVPSELTNLRGRYLTVTNDSITDEGMKSSGLRLIPAGSVLLTSRATIGITAINANPVTTNQGFQNLVVKNGTDTLWLYYSISSRRKELERRAAGSTFLEVSRDSVRSLPLLLPPLPEQRAIAAVLDSIDEAIERTEAVIVATERLRDALLHDLLTRGVPGWHSEWKEAPGIGTIPASWDVVRLSSVCDSIRDGDWIESRDQSGSDYRLLQISNIGVGEFIETGNYRWITEETFKRLKCTEVMGGDVLVARMPEPIGRALYISELAWGSVTVVDVAIIRTNQKTLNPRFLTRYLNSPELLRSMSGISIGTTRKRIRRTDIESLQIPLPALSEQQTIAAMLDGLDDVMDGLSEEQDRLQAMKASTADALLAGRMRVGVNH